MSKHTVNKIDIENDFNEEEEAVFKPTPKMPPVFSADAKAEVPQEQDFEEEVEEIPTPTSLDDIVAAQYKAGFSVTYIGKTNNISAGKLYGILARKGVPLRVGRYNKSKSASSVDKLTPKQRDTLMDEYVNGVPLTTLYVKYNLNKHGLYRILDEGNIPRHSKHISTEAADPEIVEELKKSTNKGVGITAEIDYEKGTLTVIKPKAQSVEAKAEVRGGILYIQVEVQEPVDNIMVSTTLIEN